MWPTMGATRQTHAAGGDCPLWAARGEGCGVPGSSPAPCLVRAGPVWV